MKSKSVYSRTKAQAPSRQASKSGAAQGSHIAVTGPDTAAVKAGRMLIMAVMIGLALVALVRPVTDSDFWHHLAFGREVINEMIPASDLLSSTALERPWISSGWVPSVILYLVYQHLFPISLWLMVPVAIALLGLAWYGYRRCGPWLTSFLVLCMLAAAYPRFLPRPDLASIILMIPLMALLVSYERRPLCTDTPIDRRALLLPLLFVVWANMHMLFVVGLAIAGIFVTWAVWQWRNQHRPDGKPLLIALALSILATLATPYGLKSYWFILENARLNDTGLRINELKPLISIINDPGGKLILALAATWVIACGWTLWHQRKSELTLWRVLALAFLLGLTLLQRRQIGLAAFGITTLAIAGATASTVPPIFTTRYAPLLPIATFLGLATASVTGRLPLIPKVTERSTEPIDCNWFPCEAVNFLKENPPPGKLFHDLYTGGFLAYHLAPETRVFIDGRLEVYNNGTYDDFFAPMEGRMALKDLFDKYEIRSVLIDWRAAGSQPGHTAALLSDRPEWHLCWFSDHYALFVCSDSTAEPQSYIAAHGYRYLNPLRPQKFMDALANPGSAPAARSEAQRAIAQNPGSTLAAKAVEVSGGS